jgi:hypothetical protein
VPPHQDSMSSEIKRHSLEHQSMRAFNIGNSNCKTPVSKSRAESN